MSGAVYITCDRCGKDSLEDTDTGVWKCKHCKDVDMTAHVRGIVQRDVDRCGLTPIVPPPTEEQMQAAHEKLLGDTPPLTSAFDPDPLSTAPSPAQVLQDMLKEGAGYFKEPDPDVNRVINENFAELISGDEQVDLPGVGTVPAWRQPAKGVQSIIDGRASAAAPNPPSNLKQGREHDVVTRITDWQDETFPTATLESVLKHLDKEVVEELEARAGDDKAAQRKELGDRVFLALAALKKLEDPNDPSTAPTAVLESILADNKQREWLPPDEDGCVHHVKKPKFTCKQHPAEAVAGEDAMCWICIKEDDDFRKHRRRTYEAGQIIPFGPDDFGGSDFPEDL